MAASEPDWPAVCRAAAERVREALRILPDRARELGRGEGGDTTLAVDRAAEEAVIAELQSLELPLTVITEERGELALHGGGPPYVVIDPIDGSLNAKRGLPFHALSIAVAEAPRADALGFGYVLDLYAEEEWWAARGEGAWHAGERLPPLADGPLEVLALEAARPNLVVDQAAAIGSLGAKRLRLLGSVALALCLVADGRIDGMLTLRPVRSFDAAAGYLIVREAGGAVAFPEAGPAADLGMAMRSRVVAARSEELLARLAAG